MSIVKRQGGFTVIEIVMALAITGLILPVIGSAIFQIMRGIPSINTQFIIQQAIDNASVWFSRDLSQAQTTDVADGASANHMRVDWIDETGWGAATGQPAHYAEYTLSGTNLQRNYDGTVSIVARYVANIQFSRSGSFITIAITSTYKASTEALSYYVKPRPEGALQ